VLYHFKNSCLGSNSAGRPLMVGNHSPIPSA
jgi:hypothetical protein